LAQVEPAEELRRQRLKDLRRVTCAFAGDLAKFDRRHFDMKIATYIARVPNVRNVGTQIILPREWD